MDAWQLKDNLAKLWSDGESESIMAQDRKQMNVEKKTLKPVFCISICSQKAEIIICMHFISE